VDIFLEDDAFPELMTPASAALGMPRWPIFAKAWLRNESYAAHTRDGLAASSGWLR